jgi:hypothetical protein
MTQHEFVFLLEVILSSCGAGVLGQSYH